MTTYDYSYIRTLIHDVRLGDSDAFASLFAATYENFYQRIYKKTGSEFDTQDILEQTYSMILNTDVYPSAPKTFIHVVEQYSDILCAQCKSDSNMPKGSETFDLKAAETMLSLILSKNHWQPSTYKLETLMEYNAYRKSRTTLRKVFITIMIVGICMIPLFFIPPTFHMNETIDGNSSQAYELVVLSVLPVDHVKAEINGTSQTVTRDSNGNYIVHPKMNGTMEITVTLVSNQSHTETVEVKDVDIVPPVISDQSMKNGQIHFIVTDNESGVNFDSIYAVAEDGTHVIPTSFDEETGEVIFSKPSGTYNIYVSDQKGNELHILLTLSNSSVQP